MGFIGRGGFPTFGGNQKQHYSSRFTYPRLIFYIRVSPIYLLIQLIIVLLIFIVGIIVFITQYKSEIIDPIECTKKLFINTYLASIATLVVFTVLANFLSKSKPFLIKSLIIIATISIIGMLAFFCIKLNLDSTYTESKFNQIYTEQYGDETANNKGVSISLNNFGLKTQKEYFVGECMTLYGIFNTKTYALLGLHLLLNFLLFYQILYLMRNQDKRDKLSNDDKILFDDEQNVKI